MSSFMVLSLTLLVELLLSLYINLRMVIIIIITAKEEWKSTYYPILVIMVAMSFLTVLLISYVFASPFVFSSDDQDEQALLLSVVYPLITPALISLLDLLLCMHRMSCFFDKFKRLTSNFRWLGPLLFIIISPVIMLLTAFSTIFTISDHSMRNETIVLLYSFVADNIIKVLFGTLSVGGYSSILVAINRSNRRSMLPREDSVVLRQALPIASFQLFSAVVQLIIEIIPSQLPEVNRLILDMIIACTCSIVVPLSIIIGSTRKRSIFLRNWLFCCCVTTIRSPVRSIEPKESATATATGRSTSKKEAT